VPFPPTGSQYRKLFGDPWKAGSEFLCWKFPSPVGELVLKEPRASRWRPSVLASWHRHHMAIADIPGIVPVQLCEGPLGPYLLQQYYGPTVSDIGNLPKIREPYREQMSRLVLALTDRGYRLEDTMTKNCCWVAGRLHVIDTGHLYPIHRSRHGNTTKAKRPG
jgi:hypothetical protein